MLSLFPANDFALIAVILGLPLLGAFVNGVWGKRLGKAAVRLMALAAVGVSFVAAIVAFVALAHATSTQRRTSTSSSRGRPGSGCTPPAATTAATSPSTSSSASTR